MIAEPVRLDALGPTGSYRARKRFAIPDVTGTDAAELSIVPPLYVNRAMAGLRAATTMSVTERADTIARAGRIFADETIDGLSYADYVRTVSRVSGVPISVIRRAAANITKAAEQARFSAYQAMPNGAVADWPDRSTTDGCGVWTRRGDVFAVHAAGNHPGPHELWLEALALGYRVVVRPSRREPFTPHRLVSALRAAGFGDDRVALLPTNHDGADEILRGADLGVVYGGDDVVRKYATTNTVLPQGPGRSKILLTADIDWREHLDTVVDCITYHGGVSCLNATAVLVEGDPAPLAAAVAERLDAIPSLPPDDEAAVLPVQQTAKARAIEQYLLGQAADAKPWLGSNGVVAELGDGSAALRPAVHQYDRPDPDRLGVELPFPCVWIAPWTPADGVAPLRDTLVLTAVTGNDVLFDALVAEPGIRNVYRDDKPTYWQRPGIPHDGYLGEFLMRSKAVARTRDHGRGANVHCGRLI